MISPGFIARAFAPREQRSTNVSNVSGFENPTGWMLDFMRGGGGPTKAGVAVNETIALQLSAVFCCINIISSDIAKLPIHVLRRVDPTTREPLPSHPLHHLLNVSPNDEMTAMSFRETMMGHVLGWGNGYAEIERDGAGRPLKLWPMLPASTIPRRVYKTVGDRQSRRSRIEYQYSDAMTGQPLTLPAEDVLHVHGLGYDGIMGYSVIRQARESVALGLAARDFGAAFFGNGARPSMIIKHPKRLGKEGMANLRESMQNIMGGVANAGKVAVFEEGADAQKWSIDPEDAQFIATRTFELVEFCRWFRISPYKLFELSRATFSNIEQSSIEHADDSLAPWMTRLEQAIGMRLLMSNERDLVIEHDEAELKRADRQGRYTAYQVGIAWGWLSQNDVRSMEGLNRIKDGDRYRVSATMMPLSTVGAGGMDKTKGVGQRMKSIEGLIMRFVPLLTRDLGNCLKIEADRATRAAGRDELKTWGTEFYSDHADHVRGIVFPSIEVMLRTIDAAHPEIRTPAINELVLDLATRHVRRSLLEISGVSNDQVQTVAKAWTTSRAEVQAQEEFRTLLARICELNLKEDDDAHNRAA